MSGPTDLVRLNTKFARLIPRIMMPIGDLCILNAIEAVITKAEAREERMGDIMNQPVLKYRVFWSVYSNKMG